jgi:hypothetical protein
MADSQFWQIDGSIARLHKGPLKLRVSLTQPAKGLDELTYDNQQFGDTRLMQVQPQPTDSVGAETLADAFIRGRDLIATYDQAAPTSIQPQIYWRVLETTATVAGIELIVSVQTSRLDSHLALQSTSGIAAEEVWVMNDLRTESFRAIPLSDQTAVSVARESSVGLFLFRLTDSDVSYAEMIFPNDFQGAELVLDDASTNVCQLHYRLLSEPLEKGVIRRARIRGLFLPRDQDRSIATAWYRQFIDSRLPLTT